MELSRIEGQDRAIGQWLTQRRGGRLHHAYIFHGPRGVGKMTTALALGRLYLCQAPDADQRDQACGQCPSCRLLATDPTEDAADPASPANPTSPPPDIARPETDADDDEASLRSAHPDLHVVTKELARYHDDARIRAQKLMRIPIDVLRDFLIAPVYRSAQLSERKFFVLDEAELLNAEGQNALLKTLEEPPAETVIVLVTSSEDLLLPTIRSRCQRIGFAPLDEPAVRRWLERHLTRRQAAARAAMEQAQAELNEAQGVRAKSAANDRVDTLKAEAQRLGRMGSDAALLDWLAWFAMGSIGRARLALDYRLEGWREGILAPLDHAARGRPSPTLGEAIGGAIDGLAAAWVASHTNASKEAANHMAADMVLGMIAEHARTRLRSALPDAEPPHGGGVEGGASPQSLEADRLVAGWLGVIDAVEEARGMLSANVNLALTCDYLAVAAADLLAGVATPTGRRG